MVLHRLLCGGGGAGSGSAGQLPSVVEISFPPTHPRVVGWGRRARATRPLARPPRPDNKLLSASLGNPLLHTYLILYCSLTAGRRWPAGAAGRTTAETAEGAVRRGALPLTVGYRTGFHMLTGGGGGEGQK